MDQLKVCSCCKVAKDGVEFYPDKSKKSGLASACKVCNKLRLSKRYIENKVDHNRKGKEYYKANTSKIREQIKEYREINKVEIKQRKKAFYENNKIKI